MLDFSDRRRRYVAANAAALRWMLGRPALKGGFLNTKVNSITLADYTDADGWRGPSMTYGWIQGRGLEALTTHASFFDREEPALAEKLDDAGRRLYRLLAGLFERGEGHAYFCYDAGMTPVIPGEGDRPVPQARAADLFTFSDAFVIKGLIAAAARYGDAPALAHYLRRLRDLVTALEENRFVYDEQRPFDHGADAARGREFGPWMIVLGAAGLLRRLGLESEAAFGPRFIERVLARHWDGRQANPTDLIRDRIGADVANPGHSIEFAGFALEALAEGADAETVAQLRRVLTAAFAAGFRDPGIALGVNVADRASLSPNFPWWSLPETIRAAALAYEREPSAAMDAIWRQADAAFFSRYWRGEPPLAYQTRTVEGPVDFVPATPDLDPGYHTGLSLLGAIEAMDRIAGKNRP